MARKTENPKTAAAEAPAAAGPPQFSDKEKAKARAWFKKAGDERERRAYDYAIECYITGLQFWPEAVEEGHMPLWSLAVQRHQAGGKKPGMMEGLKRPMIGKDAVKCMLNAEFLMAKDPTSGSYIDGVLRNAVKADLPETVRWAGPKALDSLRKEKKPSPSRAKTLRGVLVEMAEKCDARGDAAMAAWCYEKAVEIVETLIANNPGDMALRDDQRNLAGKLTIAKGKYADAGTFRDSLHDADKQKLLHDAERGLQAESALGEIVAAAREAYEADPSTPQKVRAYVEALIKSERDDHDATAIEVLLKAYREQDNYSFKVSADDILMRKLGRQSRTLKEKAAASGSEEDRQQYRLAKMEELQTELEIRRERVKMYPTDLRARFKYGEVLFALGQFDEAIPVLQAAQGDPRNRSRCQMLIGRAFFQKQAPQQAVDVLKEAIEQHEVPNDEMGKQLLWWLGQSLEASGARDEAKAAYGKLLRFDYNYSNGEARKRLEALSQS